MHGVVAFVVAVFDAGSGSKQEVRKSHMATLHGTQKRRETKIIPDVNIGSSTQQIRSRPNEATNGGPVKGSLTILAAVVGGGAGGSEVLHDVGTWNKIKCERKKGMEKK